MKKIMLTCLILLTSLLVLSEEIQDELWLKAVKLNEKSKNLYPSQTTYQSLTKNKKGEVDMAETIIISHHESEGKVINTLKDASNNQGKLDEENESVKRYLSMDVLSDDEGIFISELSDDFQVTRINNEFIDDKEYAKYKIDMISRENDEKIESEGFVWLDKETGVPLKMSLDVDPNKMVVKELRVDTYFSLNPQGYLVTDKLETNIVISLVFKKIYVTQIVTREDYKILN